MKKLFLLLSLLLISIINIADERNIFIAKDNFVLPVNEAFRFELLKNTHTLKLIWNIKEKHYLYLDSIVVKEGDNIIEYNILDSKIIDHEDEFFGKTKILKNKLTISIKNKSYNKLEVTYQGCSEKGFCYPSKSIKII